MPKARLAVNRGLPSGWSLRYGAYYFSVPKGQEPHWDGKKLFRLGKLLPEAYATFATRMGARAMPPKGRTLADVIDRYLREETPTKAEASQGNDAYASATLRPLFGAHPLKAPFLPTWAYQYVDHRTNPRTGEPSPVQGRKEISILSSMMTAAVRWGWMDSNPLVGQLVFKAKNRRPPRYVTDDDFIQAVLLAPPWLQVYLWVKLATGMRQADMRQLTWADVADGEIRLTPKKTANSTHKRLIFELDPHTQAELYRLRDDDLDPSAPIFRTQRGGAFRKASFESAWERLMKGVEAAGVRRFKEHDVRGKTGSDAATVESAQRRLGHATSAVTMRHYRRAPERIKVGA